MVIKAINMAEIPDAYMDLSPMLKSNDLSPCDVLQVFAMPGISACIAGANNPSVEENVAV